MKYRKIWIAGALLLLVSLACSLVGGGATEPQAEGTAEETAEVTEAPTEPPTTEEEPEISADALANLDSYRLRITWQWGIEGEEPEALVIEQEETRNPPARRYVFSQGEEATEWVQIGDTAWLCFGGTCVQTQEGPDQLASEFGQDLSIHPSDYFEGEKEYVGNETVNGINSRHYVLHVPTMAVQAFSEGEVTELSAEAWVADEAGLPTFLARLVIEWKGVQDGKPGEGQYVYEVYDVNQPITIEPPEGAPTGLPEDIPAYPNAQNLSIMTGMITFFTPDEVSTVAAFYKDQMPAEGWTLAEESGLGGMVTQTWTKDGRTLNLMISGGDGETSVTITINE